MNAPDPSGPEIPEIPLTAPASPQEAAALTDALLGGRLTDAQSARLSAGIAHSPEALDHHAAQCLTEAGLILHGKPDSERAESLRLLLDRPPASPAIRWRRPVAAAAAVALLGGSLWLLLRQRDSAPVAHTPPQRPPNAEPGRPPFFRPASPDRELAATAPDKQTVLRLQGFYITWNPAGKTAREALEMLQEQITRYAPDWQPDIRLAEELRDRKVSFGLGGSVPVWRGLELLAADTGAKLQCSATSVTLAEDDPRQDDEELVTRSWPVEDFASGSNLENLLIIGDILEKAQRNDQPPEEDAANLWAVLSRIYLQAALSPKTAPVIVVAAQSGKREIRIRASRRTHRLIDICRRPPEVFWRCQAEAMDFPANAYAAGTTSADQLWNRPGGTRLPTVTCRFRTGHLVREDADSLSPGETAPPLAEAVLHGLRGDQALADVNFGSPISINLANSSGLVVPVLLPDQNTVRLYRLTFSRAGDGGATPLDEVPFREYPPEPTEPAQPPQPPIPENLPFGTKVAGKPGMVYSPYVPDKGMVDVDGLPPGTKVECPFTGKRFRVPE